MLLTNKAIANCDNTEPTSSEPAAACGLSGLPSRRGGRKILVADPDLVEALHAVADADAVLVSLVGHDGPGHAVERRVGRRDEHALPGVFPWHAAQVAVALYDAVRVLPREDDVVEQFLGDLAAAQDAQLRRLGEVFAREVEFHAREWHARVDKAALAEVARSARPLALARLAHVALLEEPGDDRDFRGRVLVPAVEVLEYLAVGLASDLNTSSCKILLAMFESPLISKHATQCITNTHTIDVTVTNFPGWNEYSAWCCQKSHDFSSIMTECSHMCGHCIVQHA